MLRVLMLRRQVVGGMASLSSGLSVALEEFGVEAVLEDAEGVIPNETGWWVDRKVSKRVKDLAKGFDVVHAWGYRSAWACGEAFYLRKPWFYTAYDLPKTTQAALIDRLASARAGICSSRAVKKALEDGDAVHLEVVTPGVYVEGTLPSREDARGRLGIAEDARLVLGLGRLVLERGFDALASAAEVFSEDVPRGQVVIAGDGPEGRGLPGPGRRVVTGRFSKWDWICAADLVVVPSRRAGFSLVAAEAMWAGVPVLARETGGLPEMGVRDVSLELFEEDGDLPYCMTELMAGPVHLASLGSAGRARAADRFDLRECARRHAELYREAVSR